MNAPTQNTAPEFPADNEEFIQKARELRPFYFIVVVWGERFTDFLLNFCIPSLLSPHNIPALHNRGKNKFLIATTQEDWDRMQNRTAFRMLQEYVEPVLILIPPCPEGFSGCQHMGVGHKLATHMAYEANAYSVLLTPDLMLSEGTMAAVQRHAVAGVQVVLVAALRFGEEPLFENFEKLGIVGINSRFGDEGKPLIITGRQMVWAGIRGMHSETLRYEFEAPYYTNFPVASWWKVPGEDGILVHCLSWAPLLVDYAAVEHHDSSMMDHWTIDGDYVYRNFGINKNVYTVQDSDEMMLVSWAPLSDRALPLTPNSRYSWRWIGHLLKQSALRVTYLSNVFDPLKRQIFFLPVRWHVNDINKNWAEREHQVSSLILGALALERPLKTIANQPANVPFYRRILAIGSLATLKVAVYIPITIALLATYVFKWLDTANYLWVGRRRISRLLIKAAMGDTSASLRIKNRIVSFFPWLWPLLVYKKKWTDRITYFWTGHKP